MFYTCLNRSAVGGKLLLVLDFVLPCFKAKIEFLFEKQSLKINIQGGMYFKWNKQNPAV